MTKTQIQTTRRATVRPTVELDLRTPSGRSLPF